MNSRFDRRFFLRNTLITSIGFSVLPALTVKATNKAEHNSSALNCNMQLEEMNEKKIIVNGKIYNKAGLVTRSDVTIEVWHLSPVTQKYRCNKNIVPNSSGEYKFITDFPEKELEKLARIHFRVTTKERSYETELLVSNYGAYVTDKHWALNKSLGDNLFPKRKSTENITELIFNLSI